MARRGGLAVAARAGAESIGPAGFVMLLTRRACYGLLAAHHLAEHAAAKGSFSPNDLAEFYGLPHGALAERKATCRGWEVDLSPRD